MGSRPHLRWLVLAGLALLAGSTSARAEPSESPESPAAVLSFVGTSTTLSSARAKGQLALTVIAPAGYVVERNAPFDVALSSEGLALKTRRLRGRDLPRAKKGSDEAEVTVRVPFTAEAPGAHRIGVDATFFVCDGHRCRRTRRTGTVEVSVAP